MDDRFWGGHDCSIAGSTPKLVGAGVLLPFHPVPGQEASTASFEDSLRGGHGISNPVSPVFSSCPCPCWPCPRVFHFAREFSPPSFCWPASPLGRIHSGIPNTYLLYLLLSSFPLISPLYLLTIPKVHFLSRNSFRSFDTFMSQNLKFHTLGKNFTLWEWTSHFGNELHTLGMNFTVHLGMNFTLWEWTSHFGNELHTSLPAFFMAFFGLLRPWRLFLNWNIH